MNVTSKKSAKLVLISVLIWTRIWRFMNFQTVISDHNKEFISNVSSMGKCPFKPGYI